jgi:hypothetical protein
MPEDRPSLGEILGEVSCVRNTVRGFRAKLAALADVGAISAEVARMGLGGGGGGGSGGGGVGGGGGGRVSGGGGDAEKNNDGNQSPLRRARNSYNNLRGFGADNGDDDGF